jgi:hypothetical protein
LDRAKDSCAYIQRLNGRYQWIFWVQTNRLQIYMTAEFGPGTFKALLLQKM